jgi:CRP/FNR family transcriptional regulator, cyclic AMP receptor protein
LSAEQLALLAARIEVRTFAARQRIYGSGDAGGRAFVLISRSVRAAIVDEDVVVDESRAGEFSALASMLDGTSHHTYAIALEHTECLEITRNHIATPTGGMPEAAMGMPAVLGRHLHGAHQLVRLRATRAPNEVIEAEATFGERLADAVASAAHGNSSSRS